MAFLNSSFGDRSLNSFPFYTNYAGPKVEFRRFKSVIITKMLTHGYLFDFSIGYSCHSIQRSFITSAIAQQAMQAQLLEQRCMSVRPSVCLSHSCIVSKRTKLASWFLILHHDSQEDSIFVNIRLIPKFERGHPEWGRFITLQVGVNWWFSTFKPPYLSKRCKIGPWLLSITNRKSHARFRLVT